MERKLTHLSLFSGIGGLDLAAEWAGFQTVGQCEWADYPTKVLEKHWPDVPRWKDIRTLTGDSFYERTGLRTVDVVSGGFPCQPFSTAGKRRGKEDDRYLWPEMVRVIKELRPAWVIGENVAGIVRMALTDILSEMEACGYRTRAFLIPACAVGAWHRRYRVAIVSNADNSKASRFGEHGGKVYERTKTKGLVMGGKHLDDNVSDSDNGSWNVRRNRELSAAQEVEGRRCDIGGGETEHVTGELRTAKSELGRMAGRSSSWMDGDIDFFSNHYWDKEPDIPRIATGIKNRVERLKGLGNIAVPQQFYPIFKSISEIESMNSAMIND